MALRSKIAPTFAVLFTLCAGALLHAQDPTQPPPDATHRGRKYKAPPDTSHIEVVVTREANGKPLALAAVIFHPVKDGRDEGNLEMKTNDEGKAVIDVIPTGSDVGIQVIADGYATYAGDFVVKEATREIEIKMIRPRAQISTYVDTNGKPADRPVGVQEPNSPRSQVGQTPTPVTPSSTIPATGPIKPTPPATTPPPPPQ